MLRVDSIQGSPMREESVVQFLRRTTEVSERQFAAQHGFHFTTFELSESELWSALGSQTPAASQGRWSHSYLSNTGRTDDLTASGKSRAVSLRWILERVTEADERM